MSHLVRAPLRSGGLTAFNPAHVDVVMSAEGGSELFVKGRRLECKGDVESFRRVLEATGNACVQINAPQFALAIPRSQIASVEEVAGGVMLHLASGQKASLPNTNISDFFAQFAAQAGAPEIHSL